MAPTMPPTTRVATASAGPPVPAARAISPGTGAAESQLMFSLDIPEFLVQDAVDTQLDISKDVQVLQAACDVKGTPAEKVLAHVEALRPLCTQGSSVDLWQLGVLLRSRYGYLVRHRTANALPRSASYLCKLPEDGPAGMDIVVDLDFKDHFALPHSRPWYEALLGAVPRDWVGSAEGAASVARLLAAGMRLVFLQLGQPLPPWRERRALLSKWLPEVYSDEVIPLQPLPDQNAGIAAMLAPYPPPPSSARAAAAAGVGQPQAVQGLPHNSSSTTTSARSSSSSRSWGSPPAVQPHRPSAADLHRHNWIPTRAAAPAGGAAAAGAAAGAGPNASSQQGSSRHATFQPARRVVGFPEASQLQAVMAAAVAAAAQHPVPDGQQPDARLRAEQQPRQQQQQQQERERVVMAAPPPAQLPLHLRTSPVQYKGCTHTQQQQQQQAPGVLVSDLGPVTDASSKSPDVVATITLSSLPTKALWATDAGARSKSPAVGEGSVRRGKPATTAAATAAAQWLASATVAACQQQQQLVRPTLEAVNVGSGAGGGRQGPVQPAEPYKLLEHLLPRVHTVKLVGVR